MGANIRCDKFPIQTMLRKQLVQLRSITRDAAGKKATIHAILDHTYLFGWDTLGNHIVLERIRDRYNQVTSPIAESFQPIQYSRQQSFFHGPHRHDGFRPEITNLQHPGQPAQTCDHISRQSVKEMWRSRNNDIMFSKAKAAQNTEQHKANIIQRPQTESFVGGQKRPQPYDTDTIDVVFLPEPVIVTRIQRSMGMIGIAGHHRHLVSLTHPTCAVLIGSRRRCIHFRRKVVGQEQNIHSGFPKTQTRQRQKSNVATVSTGAVKHSCWPDIITPKSGQ